MSKPNSCPDPSSVQGFLDGRLVGAKADAVAEHLIACESCREAAIAMTSRPMVVDAIRAWSTRPRQEPPVSPLTPSPSSVVPVFPSRSESALKPGSLGVEASSGASGSGRRSEFAPTQFDDHNILGPPQAAGELGRIGPYRVLELLGEGGMGLVYKAEDTDLGRMVALKVMRPSVAASEPSRRRFLREARSIAAIDHDHIVSIFQVGDFQGLPYLAMPLLQGETLDQRLRAIKKLSVLEAIKYARQTAEGLEAAHARNLIHRDIKPGNLWLEKNRDRVKILDFGLAVDVDCDIELTQTGVIIGTPAYMAPEQASADRSEDARTDLFSLGSVFYRMVTGVAPFQGQTSLAIISALASTTPTPPHEVNPEVPEAVSKLIMRLLKKDPMERPQSARELVEILAQLERTLGGPASMTPRPDASGGVPLNSSAALSAIQRALLDDVGLVEEGSDVHPTTRPTPAGSTAKAATTGASGLGRSPMAGSGVAKGTIGPGASGTRPPAASARPAPPNTSKPMPGRAAPRVEQVEDESSVAMDHSYLDEVATAPPPMLPGMETRRRPRKPIAWPLVISLLLLLFMAILVLLILLNRK